MFNADTQATFGPDDIDVWKRNTVGHRIEPITLLGALAAVTQHIGLVATATTTYLEPFHVARMFASLDQLSEGRSGWNLVTSSAAAEALNFSHAAHAPHGDRYERATEFVQVVLGLWDTFEDDAFVMDKAAGLFFDPAKLHMLNHKGKHFQVRGPLMMRRSPQGRPVIVHAGQSEAGRDARGAIGRGRVLGRAGHREGARVLRRPQEPRRASTAGRPNSILIMPGVLAVVGRTKAEAEDKYERLQSLIHPELGVAYLSEMVGMDLSPYPLDGPLPDVPLTNSQQGRQKVIVEMARREGLTIRQLYKRRRRRARPPHGLRHRERHRRLARALVQERRRRRLQHPGADLSRTASSISPIWSCRNCSAASCSAPHTRAAPCARTSACRGRPTATSHPPPPRSETAQRFKLMRRPIRLSLRSSR